MATHLDLEEQEQLDQIKHYWKQYGNAVTWVLIVALGAYASWSGFQYWQRSQAAHAAVLYDEMERAAQAQDVQKAERILEDLRGKYARTTYAQQGGLLAARVMLDKNNVDGARAALNWVAEQTGDDGLKSLARLRLAALQIDAKTYDEALKTLSGSFPTEFEGLAADRKGDVLALQGKADEATAEYKKAYQKLDERAEYRRMVQVKLNALGVDVAATTDARGAQ